eukprot:11176291-Lingulodinium_polyedra.AAC.1
MTISNARHRAPTPDRAPGRASQCCTYWTRRAAVATRKPQSRVAARTAAWGRSYQASGHWSFAENTS